MADLLAVQQQDNYSTRLASKYTAGGASMVMQRAPSFAYSVSFYITVEPGTDNARSYKISGISSTTLTVSGSAPVASYEGETPTAIDHPAGSKVIISNNYKFYDDIRDAINSKLDETGGTVASFDLQITGSDFRIRKDGNDMKLTDDNQSEVSLSTLAAAAGTDEKTRVSNNDTTSGYLNGKLTGGDGITLTEANDGGNETLDIDVDLAATNDLLKFTAGELDTNLTATKAQLDEAGTFFGATNITGAEAETLTDGSSADALHTHTADSVTIERKFGSTTRDLSTASGNQTIAHGMSNTPTYMRFTVVYSAAAAIANSIGASNGTNHHCVYETFISGSSVSSNLTTKCVFIHVSAGNTQEATASVDGTNITLAWTKTGSPTGFAYIFWEAIA